jgi:hypothetical protein
VTTLVIGTYPPIPRPAAAATVAAVREAWAAGEEVKVVSPRLSAADLAVPVAGPLAGRRLLNVKRHAGADRLVLVAEAGFPVPDGASRAVQWVTVAGLFRAMSRFDQVTLVRAGPLHLPPAIEDQLCDAAMRVVDHQVEGEPPAAVTVLGPREVLPGERPRYLAGRVKRAVLSRVR